jgi:hypothetical protein
VSSRLASTPAYLESALARLTITDGLGVQQVQLTGAGVSDPFLAFSSAYQINTASGVTSPPFPITVTNTGNATLHISQVGLTNAPTFNFSGSPNCLKPVAPLGTCTVYVTFNGYGFGQNYATLSFTDNASGSPQSVGLVGNVVGSGLIFTSAALRFGEQSVGTSSASQQAILINGTGSVVTLSRIKTTGTYSQTHTCGPTLAAGAYCQVNVTFKPNTLGIKQGSISITDSASGSPHVLPLLGTGN